MFSPRTDELVDALRCLPGVGRRSAQRAALQLLQKDRAGAERLAQALVQAVNEVQHCTVCRNFTEETICSICRSDQRTADKLCVVESPADLLALEQSAVYSGRYFVLFGHLSPLDGIGPEEIGLDQLADLLANGEVKELILATNPTVEGGATASYITSLARKQSVAVTQLACGVPVGGELEYLDQGTLAHAFTERQQRDNN